MKFDWIIQLIFFQAENKRMKKNLFKYSKLIESLKKKQINPDENQKKLIKKFENMELKKFSKGLYIYGSVGTGIYKKNINIKIHRKNINNGYFISNLSN